MMNETNIEMIEFYGQQIPILKGGAKDEHGEFHVEWGSFIDLYQKVLLFQKIPAK